MNTDFSSTVFPVGANTEEKKTGTNKTKRDERLGKTKTAKKRETGLPQRWKGVPKGVVGCAHLPARDPATPKSAQPSPALPGSTSHIQFSA